MLSIPANGAVKLWLARRHIPLLTVAGDFGVAGTEVPASAARPFSSTNLRSAAYFSASVFESSSKSAFAICLGCGDGGFNLLTDSVRSRTHLTPSPRPDTASSTKFFLSAGCGSDVDIADWHMAAGERADGRDADAVAGGTHKAVLCCTSSRFRTFQAVAHHLPP
eukprot:7291185-Prymnesium_polylepis.1